MDPFVKKMLQGAIAFATLMLIMAAVLTAVYLHVRPPCFDQAIAAGMSPDKQWIATVMDRRCGTNPLFVTHVNLRPATEAIRLGYFSGKAEEGQVFVIGQDALSAGVTIRWTSPRQLTILCSGCASAGRKETLQRWRDVEITYELR